MYVGQKYTSQKSQRCNYKDKSNRNREFHRFKSNKLGY